MLNIVDLSNNNNTRTVDNYPADGYFFKATEGTYYVDPFCDPLINSAKSKGKLWGFYHFIDSSDWKRQADFFIRHTKNYFTHGIPVLDYEMYGRIGTDKLHLMLNYIHEKTGVRCLVYTSASVLFEEDFSAIASDNYGLWVAAYQSKFPKLKHFSTAAAWQYTSTPYDKSFFYGDRKAWLSYANPNSAKPTPNPKPNPTPNPDDSKDEDKGASEASEAQRKHDEAVAKSKAKQNGEMIAKLEVFHQEGNDIVVGGWAVDIKGEIGKYCFVHFINEKGEQTRVQSPGVLRKDVSKAYGLPESNKYGFLVKVPRKHLKGKTYVTIRRTDRSDGEKGGNCTDVDFHEIYLTL